MRQIRLGLALLCISIPLALAVPMRDCLASIATAESGLPIASATSVGINSAKLALIDQQIQNEIKRGFPGAELIIIKDDKLIKDNVYGFARIYGDNLKPLANKQPLSCTSLFDLASNTKMYATNYALMHLVASGQLDVNQPISHYIPEYRGCDTHNECRETRLVKDLLTHSAGYLPSPHFYDPTIAQAIGPGLYSQQRQLTESIIVNRLGFARPRGGKPVYSDVDFMLLGVLIERITHEQLDRYLSQLIYTPLGLRNTTFNPLKHGFSEESCAATEIAGNTRGGSISFPNIRKTPIQCEVHDENAYYSMGGISGHAGLFASGAELAKLVLVALNNGSYAGVKLWDKSTQNLFTTPVANDPTYGLGWRLAGSAPNRYAIFGDYPSASAFGHTGWTGTLTLIDPKYNLAIILLTNKRHSQYKNGKFAGDSFGLGHYTPIVDKVYQALNLPLIANH